MNKSNGIKNEKFYGATVSYADYTREDIDVKNDGSEYAPKHTKIWKWEIKKG